MPINKKQLLRLIKLVSALKENRYPNTITFAKKLHNDDIDNNKNISCTSKTIQRDIKTLKEDFNAPIGFDYERKGYYLTHHGWDFYCPILQDEDMLASVLGAKIAEDIMPEPIKGNIRTAVEAKESNNNPDFMDTAFIKTSLLSG